MQEGIVDGVDNAWRQISEAQLTSVLEDIERSPKTAESTLGEALGLVAPKADIREAARLTFTMATLEFAHKQHLPPVKAAILFNVCQTLLATACDCMAVDEAQQGAALPVPVCQSA